MKPDIIKAALNEAIGREVLMKGANIDDIRRYSRNRKLPLETMVRFILTMGGGNLTNELLAAGIDAKPPAFVQQRRRIKPVLFQRIMQDFNKTEELFADYKGWRILGVDGTTVSLPYHKDGETFIPIDTHPRGGYNAYHATPIFDLLGGTYLDCVLQTQAKQDEQGALISMLYKPCVREHKSVVVCDRGFEGYSLVAHCQNAGVDFLIRVRPLMKPVRAFEMKELDTDVSFTLTTSQSKAHREAGYILMQTTNNSGHKNRARWDFAHINPFPMSFRVVRIKLPTGELETLITSLPRTFTVKDIEYLYHLRWNIELSFRNLKYRQGLIAIHSIRDDFAQQQIWAALTMHNFCQRIIREIEPEQSPANKYKRRINAGVAMQLCKEYFRDPYADSDALVREIIKHTEAERPGRQNERRMTTKTCTSFQYRIPS